ALALASLATTAYVALLGQVLLAVWDPSLAIMPTLAAWIAWASFAAGVRVALPVAVLGSSLAAQAHVGLLPSVGVAAATAVALRVARRRTLAPIGPRILTLSVVLGLASLLPPLWEQMTHDPGNLTRIVLALAGEGERPGLATALEVAAARLGAFGAAALQVDRAALPVTLVQL